MAKFKVGDVVKPLPDNVNGLHSKLIEGERYVVEDAYGYFVDVSGKFNKRFGKSDNGIGWDEAWFELVKSAEDVKKENPVNVKVGDRIQIIKPEMSMGEYTEGDEGMVTASQDKGVMVFFDHYEQGKGSMYVSNREFVAIPKEKRSNSSAEHIRESILNIQEKRKQLNEEISSLEEVEKELHNKLAKKGFVMLSSESVTRYNED